MGRLTFDDLTPDDMPEPTVADWGDVADAYRDSLGDLVECGQQTTPRIPMTTDTNAPRSILRDAMLALHDFLAGLEMDAADLGDDAPGVWAQHEKLAQFFDLDVYLERVPLVRIMSNGTIRYANDDLNAVRAFLREHGLETGRNGWEGDGTLGAIYSSATELDGGFWCGAFWPHEGATKPGVRS